MDLRQLTQHERSTLRQFEAVYDDWRRATDAWLEAEVLLWMQALGGADAPEVAQLGAEAARLRDCARAAYFRVMAALTHGPDRGPE